MIGKRDAKFYSELKQLNEDLVGYLKLSQEKSPYFDFSPTIKDYIKQFTDLEKQYPIGANGGVISSGGGPSPPKTTPTQQNSMSSFVSAAPFVPSSTFSFSTKIPQIATTATTATTGSSNTATTASLGPTSFMNPSSMTTSTNLSSTTNTTTTTSQPFLFGAALAQPSLTQQAPSFTTTTASPFFSFSLPQPAPLQQKKDEEQTEDGGAEDDAPPPEPKIDKYEEPDAKHSVKCKLYERPKNGEINLVGIGFCYVKALDTPGKLQVIVRQEPDLRRVLMNEVITPNIPVKLLPKAVQMLIPTSQVGESKFYIVKVRDEAEASILHDMLNLGKN